MNEMLLRKRGQRVAQRERWAASAAPESGQMHITSPIDIGRFMTTILVDEALGKVQRELCP